MDVGQLNGLNVGRRFDRERRVVYAAQPANQAVAGAPETDSNARTDRGVNVFKALSTNRARARDDRGNDKAERADSLDANGGAN